MAADTFQRYLSHGGKPLGSGRIRFALFVLDLSAAVSAVIGGIAVAVNVDSFPREWLAGSPFSDYVLPGAILAVVVGGTAAFAAATAARGPRVGAPASVVAGLVLVGWISGELLVLNQNSASTSPRSVVEPIYFVVGLAMVALGLILWRRGRRPSA
ncbi:MAG: hypothetical protein ABSD62_02170 [Candidatus Limnocylindrales bacterium]|jgi:hypothetical protein